MPSRPEPARPVRAELLPFLGVALLVLGCRPAPKPPLRVGVVAYLPTALNGLPTDHGIQLAVDEVNEAGGILVGGQRRRVEIRSVRIREESAGEAVEAVQRLINQERVCAIIGPQNSDEAIPSGGLADRAGIPLISPLSSHTATTKDRPFVFRVCFRDDAQGKALATFARETLKARTAALLVQVSATYSRTIAEVFRREFTALGGRIVADAAFTLSGDDLSAQFAAIKRSAPDLLLLPNYHPAVQTVGVAARRAGIRAVFLGSDSWSRRHLRSVPEFDGSYMVTNWSRDLDTPGNAKFMAEYSRRFAAEPNETAALTYDAARILFAAIAATADGEPAAIQRALYRPAGFAGTSGMVRYLSGGDPEKAAVFLRFQGGRDLLVRVIPPRPGP